MWGVGGSNQNRYQEVHQPLSQINTSTVDSAVCDFCNQTIVDIDYECLQKTWGFWRRTKRRTELSYVLSYALEKILGVKSLHREQLEDPTGRVKGPLKMSEYHQLYQRVSWGHLKTPGGVGGSYQEQALDRGWRHGQSGRHGKPRAMCWGKRSLTSNFNYSK